ncbi:MAG: TonB-dependent receptor [Acidobacteria bacterium]|nr:MAG: TonB-dependent receptor [Acidobacteriota bacterium]
MRALVLLLPLLCASLLAQSGLSITIIDENKLPVEAALITIKNQNTGEILEAQTDLRGRCVLEAPLTFAFELRAEKKGYYPTVMKSQELTEQAGTAELEIVLAHEQELSEQVEVVSSPAHLDPKETVASQQISSTEIINIPFPATRDIRNALPLISGAVQDHDGRIHVDGSASSQTQIRLDGFKINNPGTGLFDTRITADAVRSIQLQSSRLSSEYGNAPGGVFDLTSAAGDDHWRFSTTDFFPSFQNRRGLHLNNWTPRLTFSGPLAKGRAWFHQALDGEYGMDIIKELPEGEDRNQTWRIGGLTKVQVNLGRSHVLTGTWLANQFRADHSGMNAFNPQETSLDLRRSAYLAGLRGVSYFSNGLLVETALGMNQNRNDDIPMGASPYEIHLERTSGNFYRSSGSLARRFQFMGSVTFPARDWHGRHEVKVGAEADRVAYHVSTERRPIRIFDSRGGVSREIHFSEASPYAFRDYEVGIFLQDRWAPADRVVLELGLRFDWEEILSDFYVSPRISGSYQVRQRSKITGGVGLFHDAVRMDLLARPFSGRRFDLPMTIVAGGEQVESAFFADPGNLKVPRYLNWSAGWEQQVRDALLLTLQVTGKAGWEAWVYEPSGRSTLLRREFYLASNREDRYKAVKLGIAGTPRPGHTLSVSYTLSSATSSHLLDPDVDNLITGAAGNGPVAWDTPHRLLGWGWSAITKRLQLGYSVEWRSGFPFSVVNQEQQVVGMPHSLRFPDYFSLNLHLERRFRFANYEWAFRGGFNNLTDYPNPSTVNNNIDSPGYLSFTGLQDRAFVGRIRFLGKK